LAPLQVMQHGGLQYINFLIQPQMFANLLHCWSGLSQTNNLSGTLTSLNDSTPENMSKLMALGHKTLHDPVLPSLKLEATGTHVTGTTSHLLLLNHQMSIFKILDQLFSNLWANVCFRQHAKSRNN
jgi:hypothetical protein